MCQIELNKLNNKMAEGAAEYEPTEEVRPRTPTLISWLFDKRFILFSILATFPANSWLARGENLHVLIV
jgi:hypothetical protein